MKTRWLVLAWLGACTRSTELLPEARPVPDAGRPDTPGLRDTAPPPDTAPPLDTAVDDPPRIRFPFCPTQLDVYAGTNGLFPGCGGWENVNDPVAQDEGIFAPGTPGYDGTLAGRLLARLADDPDLVPRFGTQWTVRSCATVGQTLTQLVPSLASDLCGRSAPEYMAASTYVCASHPAPLLLLSTTMSDDGCHGGSGVGDRPADVATYADHFRQRLEEFLASRQPQAALVAAQPDWNPPDWAPQGSSSVPGDETCQWQRPDWDVQALTSFVQAQAGSSTVIGAPDEHRTFIRHHRCCRMLDAENCATGWYGKWEVLNCDGAQALVDYWYQQLKGFLVSNDFECP